MFRIGNIEGSDNPEQSKPSETEKGYVMPSEADKQKLELKCYNKVVTEVANKI